MQSLSLGAMWNDARLRGIILQAVALCLLLLVIGYFVGNAVDNMNRMGITSGYGYLSQPANFAIGETPIAYESSHSYARALLVGLLNTIKVALLAGICSTFLGTLLGIMRLNANPLLRGLVQAYVEVVRNVPLLLQLFFWYSSILILLPNPRQALNPLPGVFLSNRGFRVPALASEQPLLIFAVLSLAAIAIAAIAILNHGHRMRTGEGRPTVPTGLLILATAILGLNLVPGQVAAIDWPALTGFNFKGGMALSPEFAALFFGLTLYTSAYISEIVRSGIQSVSAGQREAARSLGLHWWSTMRLVVLPQALRIVVPPITSTYMTLTKNSSLAVAIGYPDLVSVSNTSANQTGQAVEAIALLMAIYLAMSVSISIFMNWYNRRVAIRER
jgi:amine acid ABC transporter, permease protein, 3-TM region, His/Glu/Gln/Arg/opine family